MYALKMSNSQAIADACSWMLCERTGRSARIALSLSSLTADWICNCTVLQPPHDFSRSRRCSTLRFFTLSPGSSICSGRHRAWLWGYELLLGALDRIDASRL